MSFILDALRKVDQENRQAGEAVPPVAAVEMLRKERRHRRRQFAAMAVIAVASAASTTLLLRRSPAVEPASLPPAEAPRAGAVELAVANPVVEGKLLTNAEVVVPERAPDPPPAAVAKREAPPKREPQAPAAPAAEPVRELPRLVLQGTSVLDGKPVAVVSDRRVFEGDIIEGAVVIRIEERSVTLEFEGRRFTLTL